MAVTDPGGLLAVSDGQQHGPVLWQAGQHVGQEVQRRPRAAAGLQDLRLHQEYPVGQIGGGVAVPQSRQPPHVFCGLGQVAAASDDVPMVRIQNSG
jgi:hypothetical protein